MQQGIQAAHCVTKLGRKYAGPGEDAGCVQMVKQWADVDQTIILLNAGSYKNMNDILAVIERTGLPYATFEESVEYLNGLRTCVGVVMPENMWAAEKPVDRVVYEYCERDANGMYVRDFEYEPGSAIYDLLYMKSLCPLAK